MGFFCCHLVRYLGRALCRPDGRPARQPSGLSLEEVIPLTAFQMQSCTDSVADWLDNDLSPILHFPEAPLMLRTALLNVRLWRDAPASAPVSRVDVFTDGSASGRVEPLRTAPAGWAFTVWITAGNHTYFHGAAASTAVPPGTPYYLGETDDSSLQSELLGICWALAWLFEYGASFGVPCHLRYDCQTASRGTLCQAHTANVPAPDGGLSLSQLAALLRQCVQQRLVLEGDYIQGHAGHLGNELSDSFAKHARYHVLPLDERVLPRWPAQLAAHPLGRWAWLCAAPSAD